MNAYEAYYHEQESGEINPAPAGVLYRALEEVERHKPSVIAVKEEDAGVAAAAAAKDIKRSVGSKMK